MATRQSHLNRSHSRLDESGRRRSVLNSSVTRWERFSSGTTVTTTTSPSVAGVGVPVSDSVATDTAVPTTAETTKITTTAETAETAVAETSVGQTSPLSEICTALNARRMNRSALYCRMMCYGTRATPPHMQKAATTHSEVNMDAKSGRSGRDKDGNNSNDFKDNTTTTTTITNNNNNHNNNSNNNRGQANITGSRGTLNSSERSESRMENDHVGTDWPAPSLSVCHRADNPDQGHSGSEDTGTSSRDRRSWTDWGTHTEAEETTPRDVVDIAAAVAAAAMGIGVGGGVYVGGGVGDGVGRPRTGAGTAASSRQRGRAVSPGPSL